MRQVVRYGGTCLAFTNIDGEILVIRLEDSSLICAVTPVADGYIAHAPDGHYDCSAPELKDLILLRKGSDLRPPGSDDGHLFTPGLSKSLFYRRCRHGPLRM